MRPVYVKLYKSRQRVLEEGGSAALAETAARGKDLITSMSMGIYSFLLRQNLQELYFPVQANWDADEADKMPEDVVLANMRCVFTLPSISA